jgi:DNA-binding MarR family transcriptional regulator
MAKLDPVKKSELSESPAYQLWLATNSWQRMLRRALHPVGLTHVQYTVLASVFVLSSEDAVVTQTEVCRFGSLDPNMVSEVVGSLVGRGLLARLDHPTDRRAKRLELTSEGEELFLRAKDVVRPVGEAFFAPLGDERKSLARMLGVIAVANRLAEDE